jgi:laccase
MLIFSFLMYAGRTGDWYKGDVMAIIDDALATGGDPNVSDAFTINGQPGDLYNCSNGMLYKQYLLALN